MQEEKHSVPRENATFPASMQQKWHEKSEALGWIKVRFSQKCSVNGCRSGNLDFEVVFQQWRSGMSIWVALKHGKVDILARNALRASKARVFSIRKIMPEEEAGTGRRARTFSRKASKTLPKSPILDVLRPKRPFRLLWWKHGVNWPKTGHIPQSASRTIMIHLWQWSHLAMPKSDCGEYRWRYYFPQKGCGASFATNLIFLRETCYCFSRESFL